MSSLLPVMSIAVSLSELAARTQPAMLTVGLPWLEIAPLAEGSSASTQAVPVICTCATARTETIRSCRAIPVSSRVGWFCRMTSTAL